MFGGESSYGLDGQLSEFVYTLRQSTFDCRLMMTVWTIMIADAARVREKKPFQGLNQNRWSRFDGNDYRFCRKKPIMVKAAIRSSPLEILTLWASLACLVLLDFGLAWPEFCKQIRFGDRFDPPSKTKFPSNRLVHASLWAGSIETQNGRLKEPHVLLCDSCTWTTFWRAYRVCITGFCTTESVVQTSLKRWDSYCDNQRSK